MRTSALIAAIGRATGRFSEAWGGPFDPHDAHDLEALSYLIATELEALVQAEVGRRLEACPEPDEDDVVQLRERIERFGEGG